MNDPRKMPEIKEWMEGNVLWHRSRFGYFPDVIIQTSHLS